MDPIAHSLFGAALARTRLGRDRLGEPVSGAMVALVVGANLPDIDGVTYFLGNDAGLYYRRGLTHGPLGLAVLPMLFVAGLWLLRRLRARDRTALPMGRLLLLTYLGALSHPALDWLNTYGVRLLAPFEGRWFYGDTLFIVDPWMWLLLGAATLLGGRSSERARRWFRVAGALGSVLLLLAIPLLGMPIWVSVLFVLAAVGIALVSRRGRVSGMQVANLLVGVFLVYVLIMLVAARASRVLVAQAQRDRGHEVVEWMVGPRPGTPFEREWVVETPDSYLVGTFHWLRTPRVSESEARFDLLPSSRPEVVAALEDPCVRGFVEWMRFPSARIERAPGGAVVELFDLRYVREPTSGFGGARSEVTQSGVEQSGVPQSGVEDRE